MSLNISIKETLLARCIALKEENEAYIMAAMDDAQHRREQYAVHNEEAVQRNRGRFSGG